MFVLILQLCHTFACQVENPGCRAVLGELLFFDDVLWKSVLLRQKVRGSMWFLLSN